MSNALIEFEKMHGVDLSAYGVSDFGYGPDKITEAIEIMNKCKIGILGGDIYEIRGESLEPIYANWYCNRRDEDTDFVNRSYDAAKNYLDSNIDKFSTASIIAVTYEST